MNTKKVKSQTLTLLVEKLMPLNPEEIILFGSYAYDTTDEDSDLDIMISQNDYKNKWDEIRKAQKILNSINMSKDILIEKKDNIKNIANLNKLENLTQYAIEGRYVASHDDLDDTEKYIDILEKLSLACRENYLKSKGLVYG